MENEQVRQYIKKKVLLILKNGYKYTCVIPEFFESSFFIEDIFGVRVLIDCAFIDFIKEVSQ